MGDWWALNIDSHEDGAISSSYFDSISEAEMSMRWMSLLLIFLVSTPIQEVLSLTRGSYDGLEENYDDETETKPLPTDLDNFWSRLIKVMTLNAT